MRQPAILLFTNYIGQNMLVILAASAAIVLLFILYSSYSKKIQRRKREALERKLMQQKHLEEQLAKMRNQALALLPTIQKALEQFGVLEDHSSGYLNSFKFRGWKKEFKEVHSFFSGWDPSGIGLSRSEELCVTSFMEKYALDEKFRTKRNRGYIKAEESAYSHLFDYVESRSLDQQQREAIIRDEDNNLVVAGAGSGKTTTIIGKIKYLTQRHQINPSRILAISFTRKSCETLESRLGREGVEKVQVKTFHSFGLDVIRTSTGEIPRCLEEAEFKPLIERLFSNQLKEQSYLHKAIGFLTRHLKLTKDDFEFSTLKDKVSFVKANVLKTIKGEVVKSKQELEIANWLLFHGIDYEYEPVYPVKYQTAQGLKGQYKPDFLIQWGDVKIYLEHFGINAEGIVPAFFRKKGETQEQANNKYKNDRLLKIQTHEDNGTNLIETFSHQFTSGEVFTHLARELRRFGVPVTPLSLEDQWRLIEENSKGHINDAIQLFSTFLTLQKSNNLSIEDINKKIKEAPKETCDRAYAFMELFKPIYASYQAYLKTKELIDFNDMINRATEYINSGLFPQDFDYIVVDEFQDLSMSRYSLLKAIKERNPSCRTFCVGDDWQSIYRFTGSDISLFTEFNHYFGVTATSRIERTYRFNDPLIKISSEFVQKNPSQITKRLRGSEKGQTLLHIRYSEQDERFNPNDSPVVSDILEEVSKSPDIQSKTIFILGRYNHDVKRIKKTSRLSVHYRKAASAEGHPQDITIQYNCNNGIQLRAEYITAHKSKGLEADIVILLNCNAGRYGFPSEIADDPILSLLLSNADQFENGEERRVFYVAMTRAKDAAYLIADRYSQSKFINELEAELSKVEQNSSPNKCPLCATGDVLLKKEGVTKKGDAYRFYGCSNFLFGCTYTFTEFIDARPTALNDNNDHASNSTAPLGSFTGQPPQSKEAKGAGIHNGLQTIPIQALPTDNKKQVVFPRSTGSTATREPLNLLFKPLETTIETSTSGTRIYKFKLSAPIKGEETVLVLENHVHSPQSGFKYVEFSRYPFKYNGKELQLELRGTVKGKKELWLCP